MAVVIRFIPERQKCSACGCRKLEICPRCWYRGQEGLPTCCHPASDDDAAWEVMLLN